MFATVTGIRNVVGGFALAVMIATTTVELLADGCEASLQCGGEEVSCSCPGGGICSYAGSAIQCACYGFNPIQCRCDTGCVEIM